MVRTDAVNRTASRLKKLLLSLVIGSLLVLGFTSNLDNTANDQLNASFKSAMTTFVLVRGINAVISVLQGTEVAIEPGGVGVILTPGQVLDPINDLIERFSWVVLAAGTSLGAQILLLEFGASLVAKVLLAMACSVLLLDLWTHWFERLSWRHVLVRASLILLLLRFLVPIVVLANEGIYRSFLEPTYSTSYQALEGVKNDVDDFQSQEGVSVPTETDDGFISSMSRLYERATQSMNIAARYQTYSQRIEAGADHIIRIIAVYALQTFIFPLLFLWVAIKSGKVIINARFWILKHPVRSAPMTHKDHNQD